jgi:hypothetical protein
MAGQAGQETAQPFLEGKVSFQSVAGAGASCGAADRDAGLEGEIDQRLRGRFLGDGKGMGPRVGFGRKSGYSERQRTGAQPCGRAEPF